MNFTTSLNPSQRFNISNIRDSLVQQNTVHAGMALVVFCGILSWMVPT